MCSYLSVSACPVKEEPAVRFCGHSALLKVDALGRYQERREWGRVNC